MSRPMLRRGIWGLAIAAGLVVMLAIALPYAASTRLVGDRIAQEVGEWSGLDVTLGAAPEVKFWPDLEVSLADVTLSLPGEVNEPALVIAERVELELGVLAALGGGIDIERARFIRPTINLRDGALPAELPAEGRIARAIETAREIVAENRTAPDAGRLPADDFGVIEYSGGRLVDISGDVETELASGLNGRLRWNSLNGRASIRANGEAKGEPFELEMSADRLLLLTGGAPSPVSVTFKSAPASLTFNGTASIGENPYADGRVAFSTPSIRTLLDWPNAPAAQDGPLAGTIAVESRVMGDAARIRMEDAAITLDGKQARGALDLLLTGNLPKVSGTLAFDTLDLVAFLSAFTPLDPSADDGPGVMDADFASRINIDLRLSAAQAAVGRFTLANVAATARVDEGLAAFDISDASAFGGNVQAGLRFDGQSDAAQVEMRLLASDVDGGAFGTAAGMTMLVPRSRGTVSVILKGAGESWSALLADAGGSFSANFGQGVLSGIDLDGLLARAGGDQPFGLDAIAKDGSPIDALEVKAALAGGVARIEKAEVRTSLRRIALTGTAPLAGEGLDLLATVEPPPQAAAGSGETGSAEAGRPTTFLIDGSWNAARITPSNGQPEE